MLLSATRSRSKDATRCAWHRYVLLASLLGARTLLGGPGIATRSKDATRCSWHRYSHKLRSLSARILRPYTVLVGAEEFGKNIYVSDMNKNV